MVPISQGTPFWGYPMFDNHSHVILGFRPFSSRVLPVFRVARHARGAAAAVGAGDAGGAAAPAAAAPSAGAPAGDGERAEGRPRTSGGTGSKRGLVVFYFGVGEVWVVVFLWLEWAKYDTEPENTFYFFFFEYNIIDTIQPLGRWSEGFALVQQPAPLSIREPANFGLSCAFLLVRSAYFLLSQRPPDSGGVWMAGILACLPFECSSVLRETDRNHPFVGFADLRPTHLESKRPAFNVQP